MHIADALSRATVDSSTGDNEAYIEEAELHVHSVVAHLPMSEQCHAEILEATNKDRVLQAQVELRAGDTRVLVPTRRNT